MRGTEVGGYEVGDVMAATSDMVVYSALRRVTSGVSRAVAFLAPRPHVRSDVASAFACAAEVFSKTRNPGILPIDDFGRCGGPVFAVGPRLPGVPLCRALGGLASRPLRLSEEAAVSIAVQTARAAAALQEKIRVEHLIRVSPEVVWLTAQGQVYLLPTAVRCRRSVGSVGRRPSSRAVAPVEGLASELSALLWDLLLMGHTRSPSPIEPTEHVARVVNPALFQMVLDTLALGSDVCCADAFLRSFEGRCGNPEEHAPELASVARGASVARSPDEEAVTALRTRAQEQASSLERTRLSMRATVFRLRVVAQGRPHKVLVLDGSRSRWVVGRSSAADLAIDDANMSREHFAIQRDPDGTLSVSDLGSKNGLMVNGERRPSRRLRLGDEVRAGKTVLRLEALELETLGDSGRCNGAGRREVRAVGSRPL